jgi:hypothetical protein
VHYDRDLHVCHDEVNSAATTQSTRILKQIHATKYIMQIFLYPLHVLRRKILSWILCTYFVLDVAFALLLWNFLSLNESSKKVKLSICLKYDAMKTYRGMEVQLHAFLTSALHGGEWSASRPGRFTFGERASVTHWLGGSVGPRPGLVAMAKRKNPCLCRESNPVRPSHILALY